MAAKGERAMMNFIEDDVLLCANCKSINLHHYRIEAFDPDKEDSTTGTHVSVENGSVSIDGDLDGNPSQRRNGLKIYFWCEGCDKISVIELAQHKGSTIINFIAKTIPVLAGDMDA